MRPAHVALAVVLVAAVARTRGQSQDKRCFLEGGWSTVSFFVREDLSVGSTIGRIRAVGVVGRDISLGLAPDQDTVPVSVEVRGGEASLVLTRPLDKEGVLGPANLIVGVICERLGTNDTGFTIPINIRYSRYRTLLYIFSTRILICWLLEPSHKMLVRYTVLKLDTI